MKDKHGREISYLRISLTELCNFRCRYCMPEEGVEKKCHSEMMTEEELVNLVRAAAALGIKKLRVTGGEPLIKKNIVSICRTLSSIPGIEELCLTTNGTKLPELAKELKAAGVNRLNLSLDTLDADKYAYITRRGKLEDFMAGLDAALEAGFDKIKINSVLIGGFNDDEIRPLAELTLKYPLDVRFIEMMPMYDSGDFGPQAFISYTKVLEQLPEAVEMPPDGSVAKLWRLPGAMGNVGLISPVSAHFCSECNRIRLTSDGKLKPCLHSGEEFSIKGLDYEGMYKLLEDVIWNKPAWHGDLDALHRSKAGRNMNQIGG